MAVFKTYAERIWREMDQDWWTRVWKKAEKNPYPVNEYPSRSTSLFKCAKVASSRMKCMIILFVGKLIRSQVGTDNG